MERQGLIDVFYKLLLFFTVRTRRDHQAHFHCIAVLKANINEFSVILSLPLYNFIEEIRKIINFYPKVFCLA